MFTISMDLRNKLRWIPFWIVTVLALAFMVYGLVRYIDPALYAPILIVSLGLMAVAASYAILSEESEHKEDPNQHPFNGGI